MMAPLCEVCASPTAFTLHFGGRCCKACAAFFRRTVAMDLKYECVQKRKCEINHSARQLCRECRLRKCFKIVVRSKRENFLCTRRRSPPLIDDSPYKKPPEISSPENDDCNYMDDGQQLRSPEEYSVGSSFDGYCISQASTSHYDVLQRYRQMETSLSSRRRIMYTGTNMEQVFESHSRLFCPYNPIDVKPHDFRTFRGLLRHDFAILFDYATQFPEFSSFISADKNLFYRMMLAADFILSSSYYTQILGMTHEYMVLTNGTYIKMVPPLTVELTGDETEKELDKYKLLMEMHTDIWAEVVVPFARLNVTFDEYVLLKSLTVWHASYYKLSVDGRDKCWQQRNLIMKQLLAMCELDGGGGSIRFGELLMSMTYIMESMQKLTTSYVMITVFGVLNCDDMLKEMLSFKY